MPASYQSLQGLRDGIDELFEGLFRGWPRLNEFGQFDDLPAPIMDGRPGRGHSRLTGI